MHVEFNLIMMGELKLFMGIQINHVLEGTYIHQSKYSRELLKKLDMAEIKPAKTLMHLTCIMEKEEESKKVYHKVYRGMIFSLLYLTAFRTDIFFSVRLCARFQ